MAEETTDEEAAEAAAKAKKKKMIIGLVVGGGLLYNFVLKGAPPPEEETVAGAAVEVVVEEGEIAPIEELVVNLADQDELHYLRVGVGAVLSLETVLADIEPQLPKVSDIVIDVVSQKTFTELRIPGSTTALKEEISAAVAEAFPEGEIVRVIFTTYVMQ